MTKATKNAIAKYGEELCRKAYDLNVQGEGASTIQYYLGFKCFAAANAAINAGCELVTGTR